MTFRDLARDTADTALSFARVTASSIASRARSLLLDLLIAEDDDETGETMPAAEVYGEAALLFRPADPTAAGAPEVIVWRHGDERIVIATKDRRWQVELEKGDVCLRALGENKPRLFLRADGLAVLETGENKPRLTLDADADTAVLEGAGGSPVLSLLSDGTAVLEADTIKLGDETATNTIALGDAVASHLAAVKGFLDEHTHQAGGLAAPSGGGAVTGVSGPPVDPSPDVPDVESRHLVEN